MLRKISLFLLTLCISIFALIAVTGEPVSAKASFEGRSGSDCNGFLGFTTWDCGVKISDQESLKTGIWTIAVNILTDITVAAAYLVIGYVIYGGYLYIFSAGEASKVATGKKALSQAFIGLAIVMSANLILSTIRFALLGSNGTFSAECVLAENCIDPNSMVTNSIQWAIGIAGIISAIFLVYGGISYISSSGDSAKLQKAKSMIVYALTGLVIVGLAEILQHHH